MELNKEILKGHIDTLILAILEKKDSYGFEIAKNVLDETTFELKDGTLYISLKRLESKGLIESYWQSSQGPGNRRKYYKITEEGVRNLDLKVQEWTFVKKNNGQIFRRERLKWRRWINIYTCCIKGTTVRRYWS